MSMFPETVSTSVESSEFQLSESDRRRFERYPASGRSLVFALGHAEPIRARLCDISAGGALLDMSPLEIGTAVQVVFGGEVSGFEIDGIVVRAEEAAAGSSSQVAIRFDRVLPT